MLASLVYLHSDVILEIINNRAGVAEDDEKRTTFRATLTEQAKQKDESRDFSQPATLGMVIPNPFRAAFLREGAGLSEQNMQNLTVLLQDKRR